jgi:hypothetical protein
MPDVPFNKYRAAIEILQRGRDMLVEGLADDVLEQEEALLDGGFQLHEFLESQGARLHFLGLIVGHLEHSAELSDELYGGERRDLNPPAKAAGPRARKRSRGRGAPLPKPRGESTSDSTGSPDDPPH